MSLKFNTTNYSGFTLIELLITIGITVILLAAAIPIFSNLQLSARLNESTNQLIQNIRLTRSLSVSRTNSSSHGIYFNVNPVGVDSYTVFQGTSYAARNAAYDRITTLDDSLALSLSLASGAQEIVFSAAFGVPNTTGTFTLTHTTTGTRTVSVNAIGKAEQE